MTTLATLKANISLRLKDENNVRVSAASVTSSINQAINFWKRKPFWFNEFEESITISSNSFSLVTNTPLFLFKNDGVVIEENDQRYPLTKVSSDEYDRMNNEGTGRPFAWVYRNDGFECFFYPDQSYTAVCRGLKDYAALSADGDSNDFTTETQDLIEYEALARLHGEVLQDSNMQTYFSGMATREYDNLMDFDGEKNSTGRLQVHSFLL